MRAVVRLVVAVVAAHVEVALVEAVDHLEAEHVLAARLLQLAAELVDDVPGDLGRRRVPRRDDRRVRQEHELLLLRREPGVVDELRDLRAADLALRALLVAGVQAVEQDDRLDLLADLLAQDLARRAVAGAPGRQREVAHVGVLLARALLHLLLDAGDDLREERRVGEAALVRAGAEPEIDPREDDAVAGLDELLADRLVAVEVHDQVEPAVAADAALLRGDDLAERDVLPLVVDAEPRVRRHARVRPVAVPGRALRRVRRRRVDVALRRRLRGLVPVRGLPQRRQREQRTGEDDEQGGEARLH